MKNKEEQQQMPGEPRWKRIEFFLILLMFFSIGIIWITSYLEEGRFPDTFRGFLSEIAGSIIVIIIGCFTIRTYREMHNLVSIYTKKLREMVITDSLTDLYNQRYFYEKLSEEMTKAVRQKYPLYLVFIDTDKFKEYNDRYGHIEGNKVLKFIGVVLKDNIRKFVDSAFRYGGDEFAVILANVDEKKVVEIVNRFIRGLTGILKLSIGVARFKENWNITDFIRAADDAMYRAKNKGGGVEIF